MGMGPKGHAAKSTLQGIIGHDKGIPICLNSKRKILNTISRSRGGELFQCTVFAAHTDIVAYIIVALDWRLRLGPLT